MVTLEALPRRGGVATYVGNAVNTAKKLGLPVLLAAPIGSIGADIQLACNHGQMPLNLWWASQALKKLKAPVIYLAEYAAIRAALVAWDWTKRQRIRLILHGSEILDMEGSGRFRELLKRAEGIYTLSGAVAQLALKLQPTAKNKIVITGGAPSTQLTLIEGLHNPRKLLTVARIHPRKGQLEILAGMAQGSLPGFSYEMAGPGRNDSYEKKIKEFAVSKKLPATFHGEIDDSKLSLLYAQCGIFVLPASTLKNRIEGYGLVLLDAAAMGLG